jgi:3-oxoacyl-[acyl-carrier-protein] synthase-3
MMFPTSSALLADTLGARDGGRLRPARRLHGLHVRAGAGHGMIAAGMAERALVVGGDVLSRILDWTDRSTLILFGDGAGAVVLEKVDKPGFLGFELGRTGRWDPLTPGSGSRSVEATGNGTSTWNGREVFKFATRVLVSSAEAVLNAAGQRWEDVDVCIPTRQTSGSWNMRSRSWGYRVSAWSLTLIATAIHPPARSRWLWRRHRRMVGSRKENSC